MNRLNALNPYLILFLQSHRSFCRSLVQDGWKAEQRRFMSAGGNRAITSFLNKHGVPQDTKIKA